MTGREERGEEEDPGAQAFKKLTCPLSVQYKTWQEGLPVSIQAGSLLQRHFTGIPSFHFSAQRQVAFSILNQGGAFCGGSAAAHVMDTLPSFLPKASGPPEVGRREGLEPAGLSCFVGRQAGSEETLSRASWGSEPQE